MGGIIILLATAVTAFSFTGHTFETYTLLFVALAFGLIGFFDDYIKIRRKRNLGLTARQKLVGQLVVAALLFLVVARIAGTDVAIPFFNVTWHMSFLYLPFLLLLVVGTTNAVNLTDGLDGLAAGTSAIAFATFAVLSLWTSHYDVAIFCAAMVGALLGFLVFNAHPAKLFMGDTGALAIGGALAGVAVLTKTEGWLVIVGGVFVLEALSVMLQVFSFRTFGKRIFKMSPLHHHYELLGWSEWRVVGTFWAAGLLLSAVVLALFRNGVGR